MHCVYCTKLYAETKKAMHSVWSPTWVSAAKGPIDLCQMHSDVFQHYHNIKREYVLFDDCADKAFANVSLKQPSALKNKLKTNYGTGSCDIFLEHDQIFIKGRSLFCIGDIDFAIENYNNFFVGI